MKLLLTSNGITNDSIAKGVEELTGKPAKDTSVAFIPTAAHTTAVNKKDLADYTKQLERYGFKIQTVDIAGMDRDELTRALDECDVLCVGGGNPFYLSYWMEHSGLFDMLSELLQHKVYIGISAGSAIVGKSLALTSYAVVDQEAFNKGNYDALAEPGKSSARVLPLVDFIIRPHYNRRIFFEKNLPKLQERVDELNIPVYALDDASALKIVDDSVEIITEGTYAHLTPKKVITLYSK